MFPPSGSVLRPPLPSTGSHGSVPRLLRYYERLRLPVAPVSLRSLRLAVEPSRARAAGPPRFLGRPPYTRASLSDPGGTSASGPLGASVLPTLCHDGGGSRFSSPFEAPSRGPRVRCLRFDASVTLGLARLASGCWPGFAGPDWLPARSPFEGFRAARLHPFLLRQAYPGAPRRGTEGGPRRCLWPAPCSRPHRPRPPRAGAAGGASPPRRPQAPCGARLRRSLRHREQSRRT